MSDMVEFTGDNLLFIVPIAAVIALIVAFVFFKQIFSKDKGTSEMQAISDKIEEGAMAYLARQYKTIGIIAVVIAIIIAVVGISDDFKDYLNYKVAIAFILGAGCSILSGFIGMKVSVNSNIRTSAAATRSLGEAFQTSFRGGAISGLAVSVLSLAGLFVVFFIYSLWCVDEYGNVDMTMTLHSVVGFAFGASMAALFAQLGGGIYTKAADVGADLVGKVEAGIPEDDPRNPAVIADLVGDNVGDCAGRGADIFESTAAEIIGSMVIGLAVVNLAAGFSFNFIYLPLVIMAFGLLASLVGIFTVRLKDENGDVIKALNLGYYVTMALVIVTMVFSCYWLLKEEKFFGDEVKWYMFAIAGMVGIALGLVVVYATQYYTGDHKPVKTIAEQSESGPATNVIMGLSVGLESTVIPVICICVAIVATFLLGFFSVEGGDATLGLYGTAIATVSMLASSAFILAEDTFGPITDNAGGIAEMSNQPEEVRNRTDKLDAVGNTTKALTKGYAMSSAALAAFLLFAAFFEIVAEKIGGTSIIAEMNKVVLGNPLIFVGGLVGAVLVFFFASLAIRAVGTAAGEMVQEVREQFKDGKIMAGEKEPEYGRCVDIATKSALRQMIVPALLPILTPVVFGLLYRFVLPTEYATVAPFGDAGIAPYAVGGLIMVATIVGILMANFLNNGGGAWDNAKKYIEEGHHGGKKSPAHAAAVVGDTIGDPFKDTAGPSIHVLVKLLSTICLVTAVLFIA